MKVKRAALLGLLACLIGATASAQIAPGNTGDIGLFTMPTADTPRAGMLTFGVYGWKEQLIAGNLAFSDTDTRRRLYSHWAGEASIGLGLTDHWTVFGSAGEEKFQSRGGWLGGALNSVQIVSYTTLLAGSVPAATDLCYATFGTSSLPWPPSHDAIPGRTTCGLQRAAINIAPAIAPNGTIVTVTRAHFISRYGYLVTINPDLSLQWATPLRGADTGPDGTYFTGGYMPDGCNDGTPQTSASMFPLNGDTAHGGCRAGARGALAGGPEAARGGRRTRRGRSAGVRPRACHWSAA